MKVLVRALLPMLLATGANAQENSTDSTVTQLVLPADILDSFEMLYPATVADWETNKQGYVARFMKNGRIIYLQFNKKGFLQTVKKEISPVDLPIYIQHQIDEDFAGLLCIRKVMKVEDGGIVSYDLEAESGVQIFDLHYDSKGRLLRNGF